jgi:hypothetical protein
MNTIWIGAAIAAALLAGAALWARSRKAAPASTQRPRENLDTLAAWQPQATRILTSQELQAMGVLMRALPAHMILAQVPLARFLKVPTRHSYAEWLSRVGQLCADLVVCDSASQVVAVVDVRPPDDRSSPRALKRLSRIRRVLQGAGIPLHVWTENALPSPEQARNAILPNESAIAAAPPPTAAQAGLREPPPSTWFDNLESGRVPLAATPAPAPAPPR